MQFKFPALTQLKTKYFSASNLTSRATLNAIANLLDFIARICVGFVTNPFLVAGLGDYLYGAWQILGRVTGYAAILGGRPNIALKWKVASLQSSSDGAEKRRSIASAMIVWSMYMPVLVIIGCILAWYSPILLKTPAIHTNSIRLATAIMMMGIIALGLADLPRSVLRGANLEFKRMGASATLVLLGGALTLSALYLGTGIAGIAFVYLLMNLITAAFFFTVARSNIDWFGYDRPSLGELRQYFSLNIWYVAWQILTQLFLSSDVVLLGLIVNPEIVSIYSITKYAPEIAISMIVIVIAGIMPGLGGVISARDMTKAALLRNELTAIIWLVAITTSCVSLLANRSFVALWVDSNHFAGYLPSVLIVIKVFQFTHFFGDASVLDLTLNIRKKVALGAASMIISILLSTIFIKYLNWGIVGLCGGYLIGQLLLNITYPWLVGSYFRISVSTQFNQLIRPLLASAVLLSLSFSLGMIIRIDNWTILVGTCLAAALTVGLIAFFLGVPPKIQGRLIVRINHLATGIK